jgi:hypothetical protein
MNKTNVGGLPHGSYIVTDNSEVIATLNERIAELENIPTHVFTRRPFRPKIDTEVKKLAYSKGFEDALKEVQYNIDKLKEQE